jgi:hypothetical protein
MNLLTQAPEFFLLLQESNRVHVRQIQSMQMASSGADSGDQSNQDDRVSRADAPRPKLQWPAPCVTQCGVVSAGRRAQLFGRRVRFFSLPTQVFPKWRLGVCRAIIIILLLNMKIIATLLVRTPHAKPARKTRAGKSNAACAVALIVSGLPRWALVADDGLNISLGTAQNTAILVAQRSGILVSTTSSIGSSSANHHSSRALK